jgi:hypothetical protein
VWTTLVVVACYNFIKEASKALLRTQRLAVRVSSKIRKRGVAFTDDEAEAEEASNVD